MTNGGNIMNDSVDHPKHYGEGIECIDAMIQQFGARMVKDFCVLNAFKYLWRCTHKHMYPKEDILKAMWYLNKWEDLDNAETD